MDYMDYIVREFRMEDHRDAELLADMWNASDSGWPMGWTRGVPETAERVLDRIKKSDRIAIFVVESKGEILGYGDLEKTHGRNDSVYLNLLNVRPDYHGKGLGKALVLNIIQKTIERGYKLLTIRTWAGNSKSVPLYKKTGFFWVPDTSVYMQNYIPTAISMPIAREFFAKHDWYYCFKRELEAVPDDISWNGIKAFPYRFEEDGELFTVWMDSKAEAPTGVETNDLCAACITGKEEFVCGLEHKIRWEIVNKKAELLHVTLMAQGEDNIGLNAVENFTVEDRTVIEKTFTLPADISPKEEGLPAHQIRSMLLLNGIPLNLGTSVKPVQPIDIQFTAGMFVSGKPDERVTVKLKNNLDFAVNGELFIDPHPSLSFNRLNEPFSIEPGSWVSCTFYLQVNGTGAFATKMRAVCPPERNTGFISGDLPLATKPKTVTFLTQPLDSVYSWYNEEDKVVTVESPATWARIYPRGGGIYIHDRLSGRMAFGLESSGLGPPFIGWNNATYAHRTEHKDGKVFVTLIMPADNIPGVTIEKTLTMGSGGIVRVDHRIINTTGVSQKLKLRCEADSDLQGKITLPFKDVIVHEPIGFWGDFPLFGRDLPKKPEDYSESWLAVEESGIVSGLIWGECEERDESTLQFDIPEIPPQSYYDTEPIFVVVGRGNWEIVRQYWRWLKQPTTVIEKRKPIVHPVLEAGFEHAPLLITKEETETKLIIHNRRGKALNAKWQVENCPLKVRPDNGNLENVKFGNPFIQDITVRASNLKPRMEKSGIIVTEDVTTHEFHAPFIILGDMNKGINCDLQTFEDRPSTISVDNGYLSFTVAPEFLGSIIALESRGISYLNSAYPRARQYSWTNLWFGGIHPIIGWIGNQKFLNERFSGDPIERKGKHGIFWRGVKTFCDFQHRDNCWLRIEVEYLTFGGSNLFGIVQRFVNRTKSPQGTEIGLYTWLAMGGRDDVLHYVQTRPHYEQSASTDEQARVMRHRRRGDYELEGSCGFWAASENTKTNSFLALVASHPNTRAGIECSKETSNRLWIVGWLRFEPEETKEIVSWLVICDSLKQAQDYRALAEIYELP